LALGGPGGPARAAAQTPARPDSAARDTAARDTAARDTAARRDGAARPARADSAARAAVSDSTRRDSVVAGQLRAARRARAPVTGRLPFDRLRLSAVGAGLGMATPDQVRGTTVYAVHADYGEVARDVRAVFGVTYWSSAFRRGAIEAFARAVAAAAANGGTPPAVTLGRVRASDVALHADLRWRPRTIRGWRTPGALRPWVAGGGAVHLLDVQGAPLTGTFVERALDGVALGVAGSAGADLVFTPSVRATGQARYDLFNGAHFASVRAGVSYVFDGRRE
jgi:hypothetical protein